MTTGSKATNAWDVPAAPVAVRQGPLRRLLAAAWEDKAWWIVPMVVTLAALFTLVLVASHQQVAPFFYAVNG
jgi:hypothetical protein